MARVPYIPVPEVQPSGPVGRGTPYQHVEVSPDAFGAGLGAAMQRGASQIEQGTNQLFAAELQKQQIQNQTTTDQGFNDLQADYLNKQFGDPNDPSKPGFYSLKGQDAVNAYPALRQSLEQKRQQVLANMPNQRTRNAFDQASRRLQTMTLFDIGRHYDQQQNLVAVQTQQASEALAYRSISANPLDDTNFNNNLAEALRAADSKATIAGASPEMREWGKAQATSQAVIARTDGLIAMGHFDKAQQFLTQHQGDVAPSELARLSTQLRSRAQTAAIEGSTHKIIGDVDLGYHWTPQGGATDIKSAILGQESGNRDNVPVSANGAIGPGQIMPETFARYAQPGERITNAKDNRAVSARIVDDLQSKYPNDPERVAVGYFSGEGNIAPAGSTTPWLRDTKDANGKSVSSYVSDIQKRLSSPAPSGQPAAFTNKAEYYEQNEGRILDYAQQQAEKLAPDNFDAQDKIVNRVRQHVQEQIRQGKAEQQQDKNTVDQWLNGTLTNGQKPTNINQMPQQVSDAYHRFEQFAPKEFREIDKVLAANGKTDTAYGPGFYPLLSQVYSHQITEPSNLYSFTGDPTGITSAGLAALTKEMKGAASPEGASESEAKGRFFEMARQQISSTNAELHQVDPKGDKRFEKFLAQALPAYDQMRKGTDKAAGLTPDEILNPSSAHYLGRLIPSFMPSDAERLSEAYHGNASAAFTPDQYAQQFIDWSTPEKAALGLKARIAGLPADQQQTAYEAAAEQLRMRFPQLTSAAPPAPQAPLAR